MVTDDVLKTVFLIKHGAGTGTAFLVSINKKDYLITAKHLFSSTIATKSTVDIEIYHKDGWQKFKPVFLIHKNGNIDVAVLDMKTSAFTNMAVELGSKDYYLSQDCYFVGFPFGLKMDDDATGSLNRGYPIPFVKKGIISLFVTDSNKMTQIFLDGHNNPGFSGGPVAIPIPGQINKFRFIGVISAYLNEAKLIKTPYGDFQNNENSGIVLSYGFDHVFEIIADN